MDGLVLQTGEQGFVFVVTVHNNLIGDTLFALALAFQALLIHRVRKC